MASTAAHRDRNPVPAPRPQPGDGAGAGDRGGRDPRGPVHRHAATRTAPTARPWMRCASSWAPSTSTARSSSARARRTRRRCSTTARSSATGAARSATSRSIRSTAPRSPRPGDSNAISMIAAADRGAMLDASSVFYMDKIVTGHEGIGVVDIRQSVGREHPRAREGEGQGRLDDVDRRARPPAARAADRRDPGGRAPARGCCSTATSPAASTPPATRAASTCAWASAAARRASRPRARSRRSAA